ncbi:hypothetical protein [Almyronema epifaneia]|uniref:DUF2157 domain-containing protein n=1 Tax=Almyronema epifaneia S1 TaxID=2991925 RepID=A0ABW6IGI4_9CYAN
MNYKEPIFQFKQPLINTQDQPGIFHLSWGRDRTLLATYYTCLDQALLLWAWCVAVIFTVAQFSPIDWYCQAIAWSSLSVVATLMTNWLTWEWAQIKNLRWIIYCWSGLMLGGVCLTDYGIFSGNPLILINLCPLWLGVSALGYGVTAGGMRSRALALVGLFHLGAIAALPWLISWQFLLTGSVIASSLLFLSILQWDHEVGT